LRCGFACIQKQKKKKTQEKSKPHAANHHTTVVSKNNNQKTSKTRAQTKHTKKTISINRSVEIVSVEWRKRGSRSLGET